MKNKVLIIATIVVIIVAVCVIIFIPKNNDNGAKNVATSEVKQTNNAAKKIDADLNENGDVEVSLDELNTKFPTFITYTSEKGNKMELVAIKDSSNNIDIAFSTCQVCNGSPKAYFVWQNNKLVCKNCGNTFSLKTIGQSSGGCNPMTISDSEVTKIDNGIQISKVFLSENEKLFANIEKH